MTTGYEPLNTLKPVSVGIWIIDGPPVICRRMPHPTRATVVRLEDGGLWVHSPTHLTPGLIDELQALGPVSHLVAPNRLHYCAMPSWQKQFPDATSWVAPGVAERAAKNGVALDFDHELTDTPPPAWDGQINQLMVGGSRTHHEAVFFHPASRTLILTDLIQNFETGKLPVWMRPLVWISGADDSDGRMPTLLRMTFNKKELLGDAVEAMIAWRPRQIILSHGRCYMQNCRGELERAFRRELRDRRWGTAIEDLKEKQTHR